jgi:cysteine synthase B
VAAYASVLGLVGDTPVVDVSALSPAAGVRILVKLEGSNPGGSVKDRVALAMIAKAEAANELWRGRRIIEPSSGNTGIGLALIARLRGYPITIVMPDNVSVERRQLLEMYGAELVLTPGEEGSNGAVRHAQRLADEHPEWAFLYQYGNEANPQVHYDSTGPEILRDVPDITHFVAGLGTSGTLLGVGTFLKERKPGVKVFAVEPPAGEKVEGLRSLDDGFVPPIFAKWGGTDLLDGRRVVRPRESIEWTRRLVGEAGLFVGVSTGAAMAGAARLSARLAEQGQGGVIVFVSPDAGWKYLSTGAYTDPLDDVVERADKLSFW